MSFVVENGVGAYCDSPDDIAATINDWAGGSQLVQMSAHARELAPPPSAAYDIVDEIVALLDGEAAEEQVIG